METKKLDINGVPVRDDVPQKLDDRYLVQLKINFNPETGATEPDESDVIDLYDMIQTYKDQCGMEGAIRMLRTGQATSDSFADDGKHSADITKIPTDAAGLVALALQSEEAVAMLKEKFGIPDNSDKLSDDQLSKLIAEKVQEQLGQYIKAQAAKAESTQE